MTKEKTARLIPNAIQVCTDTEKVMSRLLLTCTTSSTRASPHSDGFHSSQHFFTSFGARDRTYMMMFRLWQNALLDKVCAIYWSLFLKLVNFCSPLTVIGQQPLCPKELWHFVHQCYGNELGLTSDDEDYVPPDDDFNTMG